MKCYKRNCKRLTWHDICWNIKVIYIKKLKIIGGCPGNTVGVSKLIEGKNIDEIIQMLKGIPCGSKETSCPDQISKALQEYKEKYL